MDERSFHDEREIARIERELDEELGLDRYEKDLERAYLQQRASLLPEKRHKRKFLGVISWLGNKYEWDKDVVLWVRAGTVIATLMGAGMPLIAYFVLLFFKDDG